MDKNFNPQFATSAARAVDPLAPKMSSPADIKAWVSTNTNFIIPTLMQKLGLTEFKEGMQTDYQITNKLTKSKMQYASAFEILFVGDYDEEDVSAHGYFPIPENQPKHMAAGRSVISAALQSKMVQYKIDMANLNDAFFNADNMQEFQDLQTAHANKLLGKRYRDQILSDIFGNGLDNIVDASNGQPASVGVGKITNVVQMSAQTNGSFSDDDYKINWGRIIDALNKMEFDRADNLAVLGQVDSKNKPVLASSKRENLILILDYKFANGLDRAVLTALFNKAGRNLDDYTIIYEEIQATYPTRVGAILRNDTYWFDNDLSKAFTFNDTWNGQMWYKQLFFQRRGIMPATPGALITTIAPTAKSTKPADPKVQELVANVKPSNSKKFEYKKLDKAGQEAFDKLSKAEKKQYISDFENGKK